MLKVISAIILSYLIGSIPTSLLIGRFKGVDVRKEGSGNVGATNVLRTVGKLPGFITLIIDIAKGIVAVTLVASLFYAKEMPLGFDIFRVLLGLSVISGHNWSVFLGFKGGKGVATSVGVLIILLPKATAIGALVFLLTLGLTKYVSLGSILMSVTIPIAGALMGREIELVILAVTICVLITYRHKANINRLIKGTEGKIVSKK